MSKKIIIIIFSILILGLQFSSYPISARTAFPYSVNIGDRIGYHVVTLKDGTISGPIFVKELNLTEGDIFELEIFDGPANPGSPWGEPFEIRYIKGSEKSIHFNAISLIITSNSSYVENEILNETIDIRGKTYQTSLENGLAIFTLATDVNDYVITKIDINTGVLTSFERKTTSNLYNYTHFLFEKLPIVNNPDDIMTEESTNGSNITWIALSNNPDYYTIFRNSSIVANNTWISSVPISMSIENLSIGSYKFFIIVYDKENNSITDTVLVTVVPNSINPASGFKIVFPMLILFLIMIFRKNNYRRKNS